MTKKHIVFAWELGGGLGHIAGFAPLAKALLKAGYEISVISKNVSTAAEVLSELPIKLYQAPIFRSSPNKLDVTYSYPEILLDLGYKSSKELGPVVLAWKNIFNLLTPNLVIADHSPSALIACKILNLKKILIGTGFFSPPHTSPLPLFAGTFVGTTAQDKNRLALNEKQVLTSINDVLISENSNPFKQLFELFKAEEDFLCTFEELDHYPNRGKAEYWGPRFDINIGKDVAWPTSNKQKIFAYIKEDTPGFEALLGALLNSQKTVLFYIPHASQKTKSTCLKNNNVVLSDSPVNISKVLQKADMIICHAGHGVTAAALLHGKRLLLIPSQLEQSMLAFLLAKRRLVAAVNPRQANNNYAKAIAFACSNPELGENVEKFKQKYAAFDSNNQIEKMLKHCVKRLT